MSQNGYELFAQLSRDAFLSQAYLGLGEAAFSGETLSQCFGNPLFEFLVQRRQLQSGSFGRRLGFDKLTLVATTFGCSK